MSPELLDSLLQFLGRTHLLVLHFPIALVVTAAAIELFRARRREVSNTSVTLVAFALVGAAAAAGSGWLYAEEHGGDELFWHRWLGVSTAVSILIATLLGLAARGKETGPTSPFRWVLLLSTVLVMITGHLGGSLVNGEEFLLEPFRAGTARGQGGAPDPASDPVSDPEADPTPDEAPTPAATEASADPQPDDAARAPVPVDFATQVQPIFERACYECHGPTGKAKGGLRLSDVDYLFDDDPELALVIPGDASASLLYQLVTLPPEDESFMPKKSDPLPRPELELIARWIDEGAAH